MILPPLPPAARCIAAPFDRAAYAALALPLPDNRGPTLAERYEFNTRAFHRQRRMADMELRQPERDRARALGVLMATGHHSDADLRGIADRRAEHVGELIDSITEAMTPGALLAWLCGHVERLQGRPFRFDGDRPEADQLRGFLARARCPLWWRRQLRRAAVREREARGRAAGEVCARKRQPYVTNDTATRHAQRKADAAAVMQATELENDAGQVATLADLAAASTANPAIRRGELMTRITGCEALAQLHGMRGVFLTLTTPSRFHAMHRHGDRNAKHDGSTPRDAHAWLCATWAKARAALARRGVAPFGFRVAEPHHDGTPHWHGLLWVKPGQLWRLVRVLKRWWLADSGDEPGARRHRVKAVLMRQGGASGYIAKYIAKNIDDHGAVGVEGHTDNDAPELLNGAGEGPGGGPMGAGQPAAAGPAGGRQGELFEGSAARVQAWASAHGIRQFQAIGQPPVTVWRELRRVAEQGQGGATPRLSIAFEAVNRQGGRRADWARYVLAQGGTGQGRRYLIRVATELREVAGRYETAELPRPVGVFDSSGPGDWHLSDRREWKPRGSWGQARPKAVPPWTRVNNCTQSSRAGGPAFLMSAGIVGVIRSSGDGITARKASPWNPARSPTSSPT